MTREIERWMAQTLARNGSASSAQRLPAPREVIAAAAAAHGITTLLHRATGDLAAEAFRATAIDVAREAELDRVLDAFDRDGVRVVVTKGAALGRTLYGVSALRARTDTDLLVADRGAAARTLASLGYAAVPNAVGDLVIRQQLWQRSDHVRHDIDLHFALSNRARFVDALPFDELFARGIALREHVRAISHRDALLHAAMHLAGHHDGEERLIWYFDIHLLAEHLGAEGLRDARRFARERGCLRQLERALARTQAWFGGGEQPRHAQRTSSLVYLADDLRATSGLRQRAALVKQHLLPSAEHLLQRYGSRRRALLPLFYARRAVSGFLREVIRVTIFRGFTKQFSVQGQTHREVGAQSMKSPS